MAEGPIFPVSSTKDFGDKTVDELDAIMNAIADGVPLPGEEPSPTPEAEPPAVTEEAYPPDEPPAPVAAEEPPPSTDEIDLGASEKEGDRLAREALEAKLALLEAHNSRLAGKLGFFEQKLKSIPQASEPYEPQTQGEIDRLTSLEQRLAESEQRRASTEVSQAVEAAFAALDGP